MKKLMLVLSMCPLVLFADVIGDALDVSSLEFTTGGYYSWFSQSFDTYDGSDAAQSGDISDNQTTWMQATVEGPVDISFWWKVSSESRYDYLKFYIDDVRQDAISGGTSWAQKIYSLSAGNHTLKWSYSKDGSRSIGSDCGWIDQFEILYKGPFSYTVSGGEATLTGTSLTSGAITIPSTLDGYPVTRIGDEAFCGCNSLTSVTIPEGIASIGDYAFYGCTSLTSVTIPNSVTNIGTAAFYDCSSLTSVTIPDGVASISDYAFRGCSSLKSVTMPNSVTNIGMVAFYNCSSLTSVTIPDGVASISDYAFEDCSSLTSVTMSYGVLTSVGVFRGCEGLSDDNGFVIINGKLYDYLGGGGDVVIPESVFSIDDGVFEDCISLTSVTIPDRVFSISDYVFKGCSSLTSVTIPDSVERVGDEAFYGCSSLTSVTIPDSVESIGDSAFYGCSSLTSVTIPNSVRWIWNEAFRGCSSLASVTIPNSVEWVGDEAFYGCPIVNATLPGWHCWIDLNSVTNIVILEGTTNIVDSAFSGCSSLTSVTIPNGITDIGRAAFNGCSSLMSVVIPDSVTNIESSAFSNCTSLNYISIPESVVGVGNNVFDNCYELKSVGVPQKMLDKTLRNVFQEFASITNVNFVGVVTNISNSAFNGLTSLECLNLPDEVIRIGNYAFNGCARLCNLVMMDNVRTIGESAFKNCGIGEITISSGLTNVLTDAFSGCSSLTNVFIKDIGAWCGVDFATRSSNPTGLHLDMDNLYTELVLNGEIIKDRLTIPADAKKLLGFNFFANTNLTSVIIESGNTEIGREAFRECVSLKSIIMPEGLLSIGEKAFFGCGELNDVTIPATVLEVDDWAFFGCSKLSNLTMLETRDGIENSTRLGKSAFEDCDSLSSVLIPSRVSVLGSKLFCGCEKLQAVYYLGDYAPIIEGGATDIYQDTPTTFLTYIVPNSTGWLDVTLQLPVRWPDNVDDGRGIRIMPEKKCKLIFVHNDGTDKQSQIQLVAGTFIGTGNLPELSRERYAFDGWFTSLEGGAKVSENSVVTANVTLYARWSLLPVYEVKFDGNGGFVTPSTQNVISGKTIGTLPEPTQDGYTFDGWYTQLNDGEKISASEIITNNVTYYAHWSEIIMHTVTVGGIVTNVAYGTKMKFTAPEPFVDNTCKTQLVYVGTSFYQPTTNQFTIAVTNDLDFTWDIVATNYWLNISDVAHGAISGAKSGWYAANSSVQLSMVPNAGYHFKDWNGDVLDCTQRGVVLDVLMNKARSIGASAVANSYAITYTDVRNALNTNPVTYTVEDELVFAPLSDVDGWQFIGWQPASIRRGSIGDVKVVAEWLQVKPELGKGDFIASGDKFMGTAPENAASVYDGYIYLNNVVMGSIQAKVAKPKKGVGKLTVAIQITGEKKLTLKGELDVTVSEFIATDKKNDRTLKLKFGLDGITGTFGKYDIDGARNFFDSKEKSEKSTAEEILKPYLGAYSLKSDGGILSVTIAKKGKVTVKGSINGAKVSAKAQALIGEKMICIPVIYSKNSVSLAFTIWLPINGGEVEVIGLGDNAIIGKAGKLKNGAKFIIDGDIGASIETEDLRTLELLPENEIITVSKSKWLVADGVKPTKVAYKKGEFNFTPNNEELVNPSGLKLSYKSKDGSFSGSFTAYAIVKGKLKKHKATVEGVLIGDVGYGTITIKKEGTWDVTIK